MSKEHQAEMLKLAMKRLQEAANSKKCVSYCTSQIEKKDLQLVLGALRNALMKIEELEREHNHE